jgi:hypothetical protein
MIGCFMLLPLAGLLLAGTAVTSALVMAVGVVTVAVNIATGMFLGSLIATSTILMAVVMLILS